MKSNEEFDTILDECLERVFRGESLESCLADHPDHADELRPLLETVFEAKDAVDITPRAEFRQEASRRFQQALHELPARRPVGFFSFRHWWVGVTALLAVIVFAGAGTVAAANSAQPDNFFYPVKLATESVRISLAGSDQAKAELYAEFADRRLDEILAMAARGDADAVERATGHLDTQLVAMAGVVGGEENQVAAMASKGDQEALRAPATTTATTTAATTTVPTTTATATQTVVPMPTPAPTTTTVPAPTITFTQSAPDQSGESGTLGGGGAFGFDAVTTGESPFKAELSAQAAEALEKLMAALESAPEAARAGLEHAIEVVLNGYGLVLDDLP
jgi:hypothetical protein